LAIPQRRTLLLLLVIFLVSATLRWELVTHNLAANDDHMAVILNILKTHHLPDKAECGECFQPKLFHYGSAKFLQITQLESTSKDQMIRAVEMINFTAGLITILIIGLFLYRLQEVNDGLKILAFGLVALNPTLIGINSQATNDSFVILFSTLALFFAYSFLRSPKPIPFGCLLLFTVLTVSSKSNGWVTALAIFLTLLVKMWVEKRSMLRNGLIACSFGAVVLVLAYLNPLNQYVPNINKYGAPLVLNIEKQPFPDFFEKTAIDRPGILSIQDGFFTFKFISLLQYPRTENGKVYPPHRTSLWTQLYGRSQSILFDNWPKSWSTTGTDGFALSRSIFILALLPIAFLLLGAVGEIFAVMKSIFRRDLATATSTSFGLTAAVFLGFILFIIFYALEYREFAVMKAIFLYPALIAFPLLFLRTASSLYSHAGKHLRWIRPGIWVWMMALFVLYGANTITMILKLTSPTHGG
jgi:hypothetical protein